MKFRDDIQTGRVVNLYLSPEYAQKTPDYLFSGAVDRLDIDIGGIVGDRHYGITMSSDTRTKIYEKGTEIRNNGQWSALSIEDISQIEMKLSLEKGQLKPEFIGTNILVEGIEQFSLLPRGTYLVFSNNPSFDRKNKDDVVLVVHSEIIPCKIAGRGVDIGLDRDDIWKRFPVEADNLRGLRGWVDKGGTIHQQSYVHVLIPTGRS